MRKIDDKINIQTEKISNRPFDEIIGHSECKRTYFTLENNDIIYDRLKKEVDIQQLPYLGPCVDYGAGDICIEEGQDVFKFYVIDRAYKFDLEEYSNVKDVVDKLVSFYKENKIVDNPTKMKQIFYETLNLKKEKQKVLGIKKKD